jgi:hypothetical protein
MCPSDTAFAISLGPTNPWLIVIAKETLVILTCGVLTRIAVTCANILTSQRSSMGHPFAFTAMQILSYQFIRANANTFLSFGTTLSPVNLRRRVSY